MRRLHLATAFFVFSAGLLAADNPFIGTWKLNPAKSKSTPGTAVKEATVVFEAVGSEVKRTLTGVDSDGQPMNQSGTIPWDGMDHKIDQPNGPPMTVAVKKVDDRHLDVTVKMDGKVVSSIQASVSANGKTLTSKEKGTDEKGRKLDNTQVYEKQ